MWLKMAAGGPRHYESETVWSGRSLGGETGGGPRGHSRYVPLSYCVGWGRERWGVTGRETCNTVCREGKQSKTRKERRRRDMKRKGWK